MKVEDIITRLQETYAPDHELVIAWWDRELFLVPDEQDETGHREPTPEEWSAAVAAFEEQGFGYHADMILYDTVADFVFQAAG